MTYVIVSQLNGELDDGKKNSMRWLQDTGEWRERQQEMKLNT